MATRVDLILSNAREIIGDQNKQRYTDSRLLVLVNDAQKDIVRQANLLQTNAYIPLADNVAEYDLPDDTYTILRAVYRYADIELKSHAELDSVNARWEKETTENDIRCLVYDKQNAKRIKVYPIPTNVASIKMAELNIDASQLNTGYTFNSDYGEVTQLDGYTITPDFGGITQLISDSPDNRIDIDGDFGVMTKIINYDLLGDGLLKIYYVKKPSTIGSTLDVPEIDDFYDDAIRYYVAGMALKDDNDAANSARGESILQLYSRELNTIKTQRSNNFMSTTSFNTPQRGIF